MNNDRIMKALKLAALIRAAAASERNPERRAVLLGREKRVLKGAAINIEESIKQE